MLERLKRPSKLRPWWFRHDKLKHIGHCLWQLHVWHTEHEDSLSAGHATRVDLRIVDSARVWNHRGEKRGFVKSQSGCRFVKVVLRSSFRSVNSVSPLDHIQINFKNPALG